MSESHEGMPLLALQEQETAISKEKHAVQAEAQSRLQTSGYHQLSLVSCEFHEGVLTLRGHVSTFYLKQVAQTVIREVNGVGEINNRLDVAVPPCSP
jgi:osmotically-inducible protein OsmY